MKKVLFCILFIGFLSAGHLYAADVSVTAQVDTGKDIYVGQRFVFQVTVNGVKQIDGIDIKSLADFEPEYIRAQASSNPSMLVINGKFTTQVSESYTLLYYLIYGEVGPVTIPPVTVTVGGRQYTTTPLRVNVVKPGTTDKIRMEIKASKEKCYVGEPVLCTVELFIKPNTEIGQVAFDIPVFRNDNFRIEDPDVSGKSVKQINLGGGINAYYEMIEDKRAGVYIMRFSKVVTPQKEGEYKFDSARCSAQIGVGSSGSIFRQATYKQFLISSDGFDIEVLPVPEQGKPAGFYGLIGKYDIETFAEPTDVYAGDPITFSIVIGGDYLPGLKWPELENNKAMLDNFTMPSEKAAPKMDSLGRIVFTQTIRPNNDEVTEIPAVELCYFDSDSGKYVVVSSKPITIKVSPSTTLTEADLVGADYEPVNKQIEAIKKGISANYEKPDCLRNEHITLLGAMVSPVYLLLWLLPFGAFVFSGAFKAVTYSTPQMQLKRKSKKASSEAISQIRKLGGSSNEDRSERLAACMKVYIGDKFNKTAGSLTGADCYELICEYSNDEGLAKEFQEVIESCESARYGMASGDINDDTISKAIGLIKDIDKKVK